VTRYFIIFSALYLFIVVFADWVTEGEDDILKPIIWIIGFFIVLGWVKSGTK